MSKFQTKKRIEGPLGLMLTEKAAQLLEEKLKSVPKEFHNIKRKSSSLSIEQGPMWDISLIQSESIDLVGEKVITAGIDTSVFLADRQVRYDHSKKIVGYCDWLKPDKNRKGLLAKTEYFENDPEVKELTQVMKSGWAKGKSIGLTVIERRDPTPEEAQQGCLMVIEKCLLTEYSVCNQPKNLDTKILVRNKSMSDINYEKLLNDLKNDIPKIVRDILNS